MSSASLNQAFSLLQGQLQQTFNVLSGNTPIINGATGPSGPAGPVGASGYIGSDGATGSTGPSGGVGATGLTGATGPTPNATPVYGSVYATAATISSSTPTTIASFTLPSAGVWQINYFMRAQGVTPYAGEVCIFDNTGTRVPNSEIMAFYVSASVGEGSSTGTGSIVVTTTGSATYTLRAYASSGSFLIVDDANGRSGVTYIQLTGGYIGATGSQGVTGSTGPSGAAGTNGFNGATGVTGPSGPSGYTGVDGATGVTGVTGPSGPSGYTGVDGATGATGVTGPSGPSGYTGVDGATGATGVTGPSGPSGYTGVDGATGATGVTGPSGPSGVGVPPGGTSGQVLAKKTNADYDTEWVTGGGGGGQGATGATGPSGPSGYTGVDGATGATGPTGNVALAFWVPQQEGIVQNINTFTKVGVDSLTWSAGIYSVERYENAVYQFTLPVTGTISMSGISSDPTSVVSTIYENIDYGIFCSLGGIQIFEGPSTFIPAVGSIASYSANDVLKIQVLNGTVSFFKNDMLLYVSSVPASGLYHAKTAIKSNNGLVENVAFSCLPNPAYTVSTVPVLDNTFDLGATGARWRDIYLGPDSIKFLGPTGATGPGAQIGAVKFYDGAIATGPLFQMRTNKGIKDLSGVGIPGPSGELIFSDISGTQYIKLTTHGATGPTGPQVVFGANLMPATGNTYDLGATGMGFRDVFFDGGLYGSKLQYYTNTGPYFNPADTTTQNTVLDVSGEIVQLNMHGTIANHILMTTEHVPGTYELSGNIIEFRNTTPGMTQNQVPFLLGDLRTSMLRVGDESGDYYMTGGLDFSAQYNPLNEGNEFIGVNTRFYKLNASKVEKETTLEIDASGWISFGPKNNTEFSQHYTFPISVGNQGDIMILDNEKKLYWEQGERLGGKFLYKVNGEAVISSASIFLSDGAGWSGSVASVNPYINAYMKFRGPYENTKYRIGFSPTNTNIDGTSLCGFEINNTAGNISLDIIVNGASVANIPYTNINVLFEIQLINNTLIFMKEYQIVHVMENPYGLQWMYGVVAMYANSQVTDFSLNGIVNTNALSDLKPATDDVCDLGATGARWRDLYLGPDSINFIGPTGATGPGAQIGSIKFYDTTATGPLFNIRANKGFGDSSGVYDLSGIQGPSGELIFSDLSGTEYIRLSTHGLLNGPTGPTIVAGAHVLPKESNQFDLGGRGHVWRDLYLGPDSINFIGPTGATGPGAQIGSIKFYDTTATGPLFQIRANKGIYDLSGVGAPGPSGELIFSDLSGTQYIRLTTHGATGPTGPQVVIGTHVLPSLDSTFDLGASGMRWRDIHLSGSSIFLGDLKMSQGANGRLSVVNQVTNTNAVPTAVLIENVVQTIAGGGTLTDYATVGSAATRFDFSYSNANTFFVAGPVADVDGNIYFVIQSGVFGVGTRNRICKIDPLGIFSIYVDYFAAGLPNGELANFAGFAMAPTGELVFSYQNSKGGTCRRLLDGTFQEYELSEQLITFVSDVIWVDSNDNTYVFYAEDNRLFKFASGTYTNPTELIDFDTITHTIQNPKSVITDSQGYIYVGTNDVGGTSGYSCIFRFDSNGTNQTLFAGSITEGGGFTDNVPALDAQFDGLMRLGIDGDDNIYVADTRNQGDGGNYRVRKISSVFPNFVTTVVGNGGVNYNGDQQPGTNTTINATSVWATPEGILYIADTPLSNNQGNGTTNRIRQWGRIVEPAPPGPTGPAGPTGPTTVTYKTNEGTPTFVNPTTFLLKDSGDIVESVQTFNVSQQGLVITCTLPNLAGVNPDAIFYVGGYDWWGNCKFDGSTHTIELKSDPIGVLNFTYTSTTYNPGDTFTQTYNGTNVTFNIAGVGGTDFSYVTEPYGANTTDHAYFGFDSPNGFEPNGITVRLTDVLVYVTATTPKTGLYTYVRGGGTYPSITSASSIELHEKFGDSLRAPSQVDVTQAGYTIQCTLPDLTGFNPENTVSIGGENNYARLRNMEGTLYIEFVDNQGEVLGEEQQYEPESTYVQYYSGTYVSYMLYKPPGGEYLGDVYFQQTTNFNSTDRAKFYIQTAVEDSTSIAVISDIAVYTTGVGGPTGPTTFDMVASGGAVIVNPSTVQIKMDGTQTIEGTQAYDIYTTGLIIEFTFPDLSNSSNAENYLVIGSPDNYVRIFYNTSTSQNQYEVWLKASLDDTDDFTPGDVGQFYFEGTNITFTRSALNGQLWGGNSVYDNNVVNQNLYIRTNVQTGTEDIYTITGIRVYATGISNVIGATGPTGPNPTFDYVLGNGARLINPSTVALMLNNTEQYVNSSQTYLTNTSGLVIEFTFPTFNSESSSNVIRIGGNNSYVEIFNDGQTKYRLYVDDTVNPIATQTFTPGDKGQFYFDGGYVSFIQSDNIQIKNSSTDIPTSSTTQKFLIEAITVVEEETVYIISGIRCYTTGYSNQVGATGPTGPKGDQGDPGGATGATGPRGVTGPSGNVSAVNNSILPVINATGPDGPTGFNPPGATGPMPVIPYTLNATGYDIGSSTKQFRNIWHGGLTYWNGLPRLGISPFLAGPDPVLTTLPNTNTQYLTTLTDEHIGCIIQAPNVGINMVDGTPIQRGGGFVISIRGEPSNGFWCIVRNNANAGGSSISVLGPDRANSVFPYNNDTGVDVAPQCQVFLYYLDGQWVVDYNTRIST